LTVFFCSARVSNHGGKTPNPDKVEITNYKHQNANKFQISISNKIKRQLFGILVIAIGLVFVSCYLKFFITETRTLTPETFIFLQHVVRKMLLRA